MSASIPSMTHDTSDWAPTPHELDFIFKTHKDYTLAERTLGTKSWVWKYGVDIQCSTKRVGFACHAFVIKDILLCPMVQRAHRTSIPISGVLIGCKILRDVTRRKHLHRSQIYLLWTSLIHNSKLSLISLSAGTIGLVQTLRSWRKAGLVGEQDGGGSWADDAQVMDD